MRRFLSLGAIALAAALLVQSNPMRPAYYFVAEGGNDPDITLKRETTSGGAELAMLFGTSDVEEYRFKPDSWQIEGATADASEATMAWTDPTGDRTHTWPDADVEVGEFTITGCSGPLATGSVDQVIFIATRSYTIQDIDAVWTVAESAGTVGIMPERSQGTEAPGSGDDLLTAAFDGTATANTVVNGTLTATTANLTLAAGDRIALDFTGDTPGELLGVCVAVRLALE